MHSNENDYQRYLLGKNLLGITSKTDTVNDILFTVNDNGSITANGTASALTFYLVGRVSGLTGSYIVSGCPLGAGVEDMHVTIRNDISGSHDLADDYGNEMQYATFYRNNQDAYYFIRIAQGYTCNNLVFWPMIRSVAIEDNTYSSYSMRVQDLTKYVSNIGILKYKKGDDNTNYRNAWITLFKYENSVLGYRLEEYLIAFTISYTNMALGYLAFGGDPSNIFASDRCKYVNINTFNFAESLKTKVGIKMDRTNNVAYFLVYNPSTGIGSPSVTILNYINISSTIKKSDIYISATSYTDSDIDLIYDI